MKKVLSLLVVGLFLIGFVACNKTKDAAEATEAEATEEVAPIEEPAPVEAPAPEVAPEAAPVEAAPAAK